MSGIPAGAGSLLGKRLGKYEILALLALGGTAEIYLARIGGTNGFEKYVVVKCLHDHLADDTDFVKMFLDEARLAAQLDHSNVVQTFELGEHENRYYMVLEFLAGLSLAMVVRRAQERLSGGKLPIPLTLNIAAQACAGLHYAHERASSGKPLNIVHRDISPQNLVISFEGVVKVVDFGIARAEMRETKTKAGTIKGKFAYMSPEQCVANNVDRRTDVFALGVIIWELLTGKRLFKRNSPYETYQAVIECNVPPVSSINHEVDPAIDKIIAKAVGKAKEDRYPTAEAFGDALQGYLHHRGKGSGPGEVGRFFDQYFSQEIEEHGERMRELISGREAAGDSGLGWGEEDDKGLETVDLSSKKADRAMHEDASIELSGRDLIPGTGDSSLDQVLGDIDGEPSGEDEDMPAERTRIEANPLEKLRELEAAHTRAPLGSVSGVAPLPAPPTAPYGKNVIGAAQSGRFPELANMATQIAHEGRPPEMASTELGKRPPIDPNAPQFQVQAPVIGNPGLAPVMRAGSQSATQAAVLPLAPTQNHPVQHPTQNQPVQHPPPSYPQMTPAGGSPYPVVSGRPYSTDLAPSHLPSPQLSPYAGKSASVDPGQLSPAANLMSPVGQGFPQTDWAAAAAQPAKALPPWMLAALFVGALFAALLITIIIAKIVH
ncbi:MAG: serine/threonine protein kinase [Myxococcales bacterium]|nr:serine/threonine protein kinase [Myxococcales bacterium]